MSYLGADWLTRPERIEEEQPDKMLAALHVRPGMVVADIGAGVGYHALRLSPIVGPEGRVYATDLQPEMLELLRKAASARGVTNVIPALSSDTATGLPAGAVDLALMVDVYHELEFPYEVLASIVRALKPGGRVAFVEYRAEDPNVPIKALHKMSEAQVKREAAVHPLVWERSIETLPWQHVLVFRRRE